MKEVLGDGYTNYLKLFWKNARTKWLSEVEEEKKKKAADGKGAENEKKGDEEMKDVETKPGDEAAGDVVYADREKKKPSIPASAIASRCS